MEVLKTRIHSSSNPDYWEPSRPVKKYKMDPINKEELEKAGNKATTRWDPIEMNVVYCDCKEYVSAYDLFFYHYNFHKSKTINHRQDYIRKQSVLLNKIISKDLNTYDYYGKEVVYSNIHLSYEAIKTISYIMGQEYEDVQIVTHTLYNKGSDSLPSKTIFIRKKDLEYSEAFAGTGESRMALLVNDILNAPEHSLILLDEPEISLHPLAIKKFEKFLVCQSLLKDQQIVVTTHSPYMIQDLPENSIKFFKKNADNQVVVINENEGQAAFELDNDVRGNIQVYVEDKLSKALFEKVLDTNYAKEKINVDVIPGGANTIINEYIKPEAIMQNNVFFVLDGDKKTNISNSKYVQFFDFKNHSFRRERLSPEFEDQLDEMIKELTDQELKFSSSGNKKDADKTQQKEMKLKFLQYWMSHVFFLPCLTPEIGLIEEYGEKIEENDKSGKKYFKDKAMKEIGDDESKTIFVLQKGMINKMDKKGKLASEIKKIIEKIL